LSAVDVAVVVLGELARSPRMLNHARMLAEERYETVLVGYGGRSFEAPANVRMELLHPMRRAGEGGSRLAFLIRSAVRMALLWGELCFRLIRIHPRAILVQNPPAFPTLAAARIAARFCGARLIVDWHNYGFTLLALRLGSGSLLVRMSRWYEFAAGRKADAHLCVSEALRRDLQRAGISAQVLYDRPVAIASPTGTASVPGNSRPVAGVCPLGWTADEDTELLIAALAMLRAGEAAPVELHLTGDGPRREAMVKRLGGLHIPGVVIRTGYLPEAEYRALLQRADFGLSLHRSSSGLDLAMKVVDLFAVRVPVCALDYGGSLPEQIQDRQTGVLFRDAEGLAQALDQLREHPECLAHMRANIEREWKETWAETWKRTAAPLFSTHE
jgi:beta-1,4-mannosyltransferase